MNLNNLTQKLRPYILFSTLNTVWRMLDKEAETILDVGCGKGEPMAFINRQGKFKVIGIDIFRPYLEQARKERVYQSLILGDVRHFPFKDKSFDAVLCLEVLEHLEKEEGERLLDEIERVAKKQILLSTPVGFSEQDEVLLEDSNPFQAHRSGWQPREFEGKGYKVRGSTIRFLKGRAGDISFPRFLKPFGYFLWVMLAPLAYLLPNFSADMVAEKKKVFPSNCFSEKID